MLLQDLFTPQHIILDLSSCTKDELFLELADAAFRIEGAGLPREAVLAALYEREAKMSTAIKPGVALPHGKLDLCEGVLGLLGISRKGLAYDAPDGEPVRLVFMLLASPRKPEEYLHCLKRLARLLDTDRFVGDLLRPVSVDDIFLTLKEYEDALAIPSR